LSWGGPRRANSNRASSHPDGRPADACHLIRLVKRKLKKIQYRPHLISGCLAATGLTIEAW